jgi:hypothetical protein
LLKPVPKGLKDLLLKEPAALLIGGITLPNYILTVLIKGVPERGKEA